MASSELLTIASLFKHSLTRMYNEWDLDKPLRTGAPHASAILQAESDWCLRRQVLLALYAEEARHPEIKPWDWQKNARFLHGWYLHEKYQMLLSKYGRAIEIETKHYDGVRFLWFTPDVLYPYPVTEQVIEIKGYKAETWEKLDEAKDPPKDAWHQCNLYCHLLQIERGLVLVENKNTQEPKVWAIEHDATLARPYTDRMYSVKAAITRASHNQSVPERACKSPAENRACNCPVKDFCFSGRVEKR